MNSPHGCVYTAQACTLTRVINNFYKDAKLGHLFGVPRLDWKGIKAAPQKNAMPKMMRIIDVVKEYKKKGPDGGYVVSDIFMQIPTKTELPDYHRIVRGALYVAMACTSVGTKHGG